MADEIIGTNVLTDTTTKVTAYITGIDWIGFLGWIFLFLILIGFSLFVIFYYRDKKIFNKRITAFEEIGGYWEPTYRDRAKVVKLGKGGFEILYLKKLKTWRIAYGGRVGKNDYYFFIMPDGYWYNGKLGAGIKRMDETGGLVEVRTTNPLMRAQYTALEKQIDMLSGEKINFLDKYGGWILGGVFVLITGVLLWLMFREFSSAMSQLKGYHEGMKTLTEAMTKLIENSRMMENERRTLVPV